VPLIQGSGGDRHACRPHDVDPPGAGEARPATEDWWPLDQLLTWCGWRTVGSPTLRWPEGPSAMP